MTPELKEIALRVVSKYKTNTGYLDGKLVPTVIDEILAALPATSSGDVKPEPVAEFIEDCTQPGGARLRLIRPLKVGTLLYTSPPATSEQPVQFPFILDKQTAKFVNREIKYEEKIKELEAQLGIAKGEWYQANNHKIYAEHISKKLEAQNAALLVAMEAKNAAISLFSKQYPHMIKGYMVDALTLSPSTELLEARDRKRDAALLRLAEEQVDADDHPTYIWRLAKLRESGEWRPELGD